ncbi:sigma-E processing peptidase SpoIIGA [Sporosarcina sp. Te-1]|uniref:sigma-E processing peptidase SpoIIGA n=1 Tax=Sporosarcina sp. Te-1 TaxID=2818390 RepID=UPI001A9F6CF5|nr:sigma-E processing peptidase SpoIIGA [Sporosarcina sp. Te-1]QTD42397.1 sigma-E processing peptidase SpoIIGA [Sporosarcina sp. Te-1]
MYGELIIAINMVFNFAVLSFANKTGNLQAARGRLWFASFAGALPVTIFSSSFISMIFSFLIMTYCAFGKAFELWRKAVGIVLVGALFSGGLLTVYSSRSFAMPTYLSIFLSALIAYISLAFFKGKWLDVRVAKQMDVFASGSTLRIWNQDIQLQVFIDTGNSCIEPMTGAPVHFVSYRAVKRYIPEELIQPLEQWNPKELANLQSFPIEYQKGIRLIRLTTVQGVSWAIGFKYERWSMEEGELLQPGYLVLTKEDNRYPHGAEAILHVSAMESISKERGTVHVV